VYAILQYVVTHVVFRIILLIRQ